MKRFFFVFALLFIAAEANAKVNYSIGVKGGLAFGRFKNYNLEGGKKSSLGGQYSPQIGLSGAITGRIWFNKYLGLELGGEFNTGGNKKKWTQPMGKYGGLRDSIIEQKFNYITLPLVLHAGWSNERLKVFGTIGGYVAVPVHGRVAELRYMNDILKYENKYDADFKKVYSRLDMGIRFGAGLEYAFSKNKKHAATFDATYDWGLTKVYRKPFADLDDKTNITNSRTLIQIGYAYKFGGDLKTEKTPKTEKTEKVAKVKEEKPAKVKEEKIKKEKPAKVKKQEPAPKTMTE